MTIFQITSALVYVVVSVVNGSSGESELNWKKHYDSAKRVAQATKKPLVVVIENPAKANEKIDVSKLGDEDRKLLSKGKFELCRVDATTDYGKRVAAAFGAKRFPYTVVTDDQSKRIVFRKPGQMSKQDWRFALAKSNVALPKLVPASRVQEAHVQASQVQRYVESAPHGEVIYQNSNAGGTVYSHRPAYPSGQFPSSPGFNSFPQGIGPAYGIPCNT